MDLRGHMTGARRLGITDEQLHELLLQVDTYVDVPAAVNDLNVSREAFAVLYEQV